MHMAMASMSTTESDDDAGPIKKKKEVYCHCKSARKSLQFTVTVRGAKSHLDCSTVASLLALKLNIDQDCFDYTPLPELLKQFCCLEV